MCGSPDLSLGSPEGPPSRVGPRLASGKVDLGRVPPLPGLMTGSLRLSRVNRQGGWGRTPAVLLQVWDLGACQAEGARVNGPPNKDPAR